MSWNPGGQYEPVASPWADYGVYSFPDASRIEQVDQQPVMDAMNGIIAVNWQATEPHWTAASSPFDKKYSLILVRDGTGLVAFSVYRMLQVAGSPAIYRSGTEVLPAHQGRGLYRFFTTEVLKRTGAPDGRGGANVLYGWRTRNPIVWAANAKICDKVSPSLLVEDQDPALQAVCVEMCAALYPGKPLELPDMIMRGAYGHIKHHRQPYRGLVEQVDAAMSRIIPELGRRVVLRRLREDVMTVSGQQTAAVPISRLIDRGYLAWSTVAIAYAVAFLQRVSPQSVSLSFMTDFGTDAAGVAMLASSYFWGYTLMQIPAGILVDRYGVKRVVLVSMAASSFGSAAFALAPNLLDVFAARLIIACGDALVFTAMLKLVAQSFSDQRFGIMSGISQVAGYVGGAMATSPLAAAVTGFGWRACFIFIACVGVANLVIASMALRPDPASHSERTIKSVLASSGRALGRSANWGCAMSFASHFAVVTTLSGVWGIPMVAHVFKITPSAAGAPLLAFMGGNAIGSIFLGHIADRMAAALDTALIRICVLRMLLIAILLPPIAHAMGFVYTGVVFAALGLVAGGTVPLVLKCTKRLYTAELIGVGASVNTTVAGIFAGASQPVIALAMVTFSPPSGNGALNAAASVTDSGYGALIVILLLMSLPGIAGPLMMRRRLIDRG